MRRSPTIILSLLLSALATGITFQLFDGKAGGSEQQKKWFGDKNGHIKWSFGCNFPKGGFNAVDIDKIKKNQSSTCPSLCYEDNRCTHFIYSKGYCYLKMFKLVDTLPKSAIYNNPGGLCGFVVERPNVVKKWAIGGNGRIRWSTNCDYPNAKFNIYTKIKVVLADGSKCGDHCLSIKRCTHFGYMLGMCWIKDIRGAPVVQTVDKNVPFCGFIPERQDASIKQRTNGTAI